MFSRSWSEGKNLIIPHNFAGMKRRIECALKHILLVINRFHSRLYSECLPNNFTLIAMPFFTCYAIKTFQLNSVCVCNVNQTWMGSKFILLNRKIFMVKSQIHFRLLLFPSFHLDDISPFIFSFSLFDMLYQRMGVNCGEFSNICS